MGSRCDHVERESAMVAACPTSQLPRLICGRLISLCLWRLPRSKPVCIRSTAFCAPGAALCCVMPTVATGACPWPACGVWGRGGRGSIATCRWTRWKRMTAGARWDRCAGQELELELPLTRWAPGDGDATARCARVRQSGPMFWRARATAAGHTCMVTAMPGKDLCCTHISRRQQV